MSGRAVLVALFSLLCGITCLRGQKCDPAACSCKNAKGAVEVDLSNVNKLLREQRHNFIYRYADYTVRASLCDSLVCGDANTSAVCLTYSDGHNESYGDLSNVMYTSVGEEDGGYSVVLEMMGDTTPANTTRRSRIHLNCQQPFQNEFIVLLDGTTDISQDSLNITINTSLPCIPGASSPTASSTPSAESFSSSILVPFITPTMTPSSQASSSPGTPSPPSSTPSPHSLPPSTTTTKPPPITHTFTPPTSPTHTTTTAMPTTLSSSTPTSATPSSTHPSSTTPTSTTPTSTTPMSTTPTSTSPMSTTPTSTSPVSTIPTASSFPSSTSLPSCPPQSCPSCASCSEKLALSLGLSIPGTALLTILLMVLICACFQKSKKKGVYIRMAPTVYFDEDDRD